MITVDRLHTAYRLGLYNIFRVIRYRVSVKLGINPVKRLSAHVPNGPFFEAPKTARHLPARQGWWAYAEAFGQQQQVLGSTPPNWCQHIFSQKTVDADQPWWQLPDFDISVGDIKAIWEYSRFDWVLVLSQHAANNNAEALTRLNHWLQDWLQQNTPYNGLNWKCGQEASIRVMHLAMAAIILEQNTALLPSLSQLIELHLRRIAPTLSYALAQDNNHGTSEAAALFIGGSWLRLSGQSVGTQWEKLGRKWLENRIARLIENDGSFSQYSTNYHRVMLDTLSMVECWRQQHGLPSFSQHFYHKAKKATSWLYTITCVETGDAPNLGANDGARLLPLTDTDYRDYRPSVQLAAALFHQRCVYKQPGEWDIPLQWLHVTPPMLELPPPASKLFDCGGYAVLHCNQAMVLLRYPRFRFRPSQCDLLHVDFWVGKDNLLRDAGTFSYHCESQWQDYFPSGAAHNSIQFDQRDAMPRISRFLLGHWPKARNVRLQNTTDKVVAQAAYQDWQGAKHQRQIELSKTSLCVIDKVDGVFQQAVLRWRLQPGDWHYKNGVWQTNHYQITIESNVPIIKQTLVKGFESRYYLNKQTLPVLEIVIHQPGTLHTTIKF